MTVSQSGGGFELGGMNASRDQKDKRIDSTYLAAGVKGHACSVLQISITLWKSCSERFLQESVREE